MSVMLPYIYNEGELFYSVYRGPKASLGSPAGCNNGKGYWRVRVKGKHVLRSRIVWEMFNGVIPEGKEIDHKNGNSLDDRIENLRLATRSQNIANSVVDRGESGYRNVYRSNSGKGWIVRMKVNKMNVYGGRVFVTASEANKEAERLRSIYYANFKIENI